ncbi:MAG: hypothetical protein LBD23_05445 [Oscillospiraceae bacterium]|jgi:hypothetical protein|nr:hypothetical protein [Oscillospiraceae bacterium]
MDIKKKYIKLPIGKDGKAVHINKIKAFISTKRTQGQRSIDFCNVPENELVRHGVICEKHKNTPDEKCGCDRSLKGFYCDNSTTTFKVAFIDMTKKQYIEEYMRTNPLASIYEKDDNYRQQIQSEAENILDLAENHEIDTVFELCKGNFYVRHEGAVEPINMSFIGESANKGKIKNIKSSEFDDGFECECGNYVGSDGFSPCDKEGNEMEPCGKWDYDSICASCGLIYHEIF